MGSRKTVRNAAVNIAIWYSVSSDLQFNEGNRVLLFHPDDRTFSFNMPSWTQTALSGKLCLTTLAPCLMTSDFYFIFCLFKRPTSLGASAPIQQTNLNNSVMAQRTSNFVWMVTLTPHVSQLNSYSCLLNHGRRSRGPQPLHFESRRGPTHGGPPPHFMTPFGPF